MTAGSGRVVASRGPAVGADALAERARHVAALHAATEPRWLAARRADAFRRFDEDGLPGPRDEAWRSTSLARVASGRFDAPDPDLAYAREAIEPFLLRLHGGISLVFVDGRFAPALSGGPSLGPDLHVGSLAAAARERPGLVEPWFGRLAGPEARPLVAIATALFEDGALVHLGSQACIPTPVDVLHVSTGRVHPSHADSAGGGGAPACPVVAPRTLIVAEPGARATILERHVSLPGAGPYLTLPVTEVVAGPHSVVEHVLWQEDTDAATDVASVSARVEEGSRFTSHTVTLGGALSRAEVDVLLEAQGGEATLHGIYVVLGERHADHRTRLHHRVPRCTSRQTYKGILAGRGTGVFDGRVVVHAGAAGTDARQANHNLLLSRDAAVDAKPTLEIFHDDVQCAHGATVGRLDDDALFYLRSRGIGLAQARELLVRAFAREVSDRLPVDALRTGLDEWMSRRLRSLLGEEAS